VLWKKVPMRTFSYKRIYSHHLSYCEPLVVKVIG
jgi:hypothetical protein